MRTIKVILSLILIFVMVFNILQFSVLKNIVNAEEEGFENEYNFTSPDKDENGNDVDNGNIKSAEWTSEDKSTADIKITYNKPKNKILYLGSLCNSHGLTSFKLGQEINSIAQLGDVDAYFSGHHYLGMKYSSGDLYSEEDVHIFDYLHIEQGGILNKNFDLNWGRHANLFDYVKWVKEAIQTNGNGYGLIVFSFDGLFSPMYMSAMYTGELYQNENGDWIQDDERVREIEQQMREVAEILKPYYESSKVVWIMGDEDIRIDTNEIFIPTPNGSAVRADTERLHKEDGSYYYIVRPDIRGNGYYFDSGVENRYLLYPRTLAEYNHILKSYNKTYVTENGEEKEFDIANNLSSLTTRTGETGPNMNDLSWQYFSGTEGGRPRNNQRKQENIHRYIMSQRPFVWQYALYDPETYLEVTNSDGSFIEIPSFIPETIYDNSNKEMSHGIITDSEKQWKLDTPKTDYGTPKKVEELTSSMIKYHEIRMTDTVNEGLIPEGLELQFQNKEKEWITFSEIELENGEGNSTEEIPGTFEVIEIGRRYIIKGYNVEKNSDNTYKVCVDVLNKNQVTGKALEINDNIRLIIHTKADKSFAVENNEVNGLMTYGPKNTNKGDAIVSTTYYKDKNPTNTDPENVELFERIRYLTPKLTKTIPIHYNSDEGGYVTNNGEKTEINNEEAILGHNPNGSETGNDKPFGLTTNSGYRFSHWVADKDVVLMDGTEIKAGELITSEQVKQVNIQDEVTFTAIHIKVEIPPIRPDDPEEPKIPVEPDEPKEPDNPKEPDEPKEPDNPKKPDEPKEPGDPEEPAKQDEEENAGVETENPKTGDKIYNYYVILSASLIGIYFSIKSLKNRRKD